MTSQDLIKKILYKLGRFKWLIFLGAVCMAVLLYLYAKKQPVVYTVRASVFPLTASADGGGASKLSELIGGTGGSTKSLSDEATINIEEVAKSRATKEAVVAERIQKLSNKSIAQLLIENYNRTKSFFARAIEIPKYDSALIYTGASLLGNMYTAKVNKNSLLEVYFNCADQRLVTPVSYILIDKISSFYKELKIKKAKFDFDFTEKKVDSLQNILNKYDRQQIQLSNTTLFVPDGRLEYEIPKQNLQNDRLRVAGQRNGAASNREEAMWRLQKVTPIIEILDRPEPPFTESKPSGMIYGAAGFVLGCILFSLIFIWGILYNYFQTQINKAIFADSTGTVANTTTTA